MARTSNFIIIFNVIMLILGVVLFGVSVYVKQNFNSWTQVLSTGAIWVGIFAGLFMIIISFTGCYAAQKNKKSLLCMYLICVGVILTLQIAAAVVLINYSGRFQSVINTPSGSLTNSDDIYLNNAVMSLFNYCCSGCSNSAVNSYVQGLNAASSGTCNNPANYWTSNPAFPYCTDTAQVAYGLLVSQTWTPVVCDNPGPCTSTSSNNCWYYYSGSIQPSQYPYPPVAIDYTFCTLLKTTTLNNQPLVAYPQMGGCGGGSVSAFLSNLDTYFRPKMLLAGVIFALVAAFQTTVIFVGFYVICCVSRRDVVGDYDS
jgi:hypothetical protein